ncbi:YihY/virulence factor BrkB family protein [Leptolyngbya sp. FACHB-711]|uniref:YihY/virulence factor BrkB family protein n=1 Tax=unclassified Leptolyngbya TaxID=2650499 RepID=UPI001682CE4D|nr:YihY/virulence factor BrkB family protein [Leptolyngbya sp. FACHB-711]MBD1851988.1 YihY/virulence factor BrkB family protein [Cyanobacteria bacterium FACHB-502]MBD2026274.1 YihY/virulence factor BrkB family protein [Leptolyngbya sp. FACHB-711]
MLSSRFVRFFLHINFRNLRQVLQEVGDRRLFGLSAEMAYNNLLALFPMLLGILAAIGSLKIPQDRVDFVARQLLPVAPPEVIFLVQGFINQTRLPQGRVVISISIIIALWIASGAVSAAMNAMDQIYQTPPAVKRSFWQAKVVALILTVVMLAFTMSASYLVMISDWLLRLGLERYNTSAVVEAFSTLIGSWMRWLVALGIVTIAFSILYRQGPSRWLPGTPLLPGAMIAAFLWALMSQTFNLYVRHFANFNFTYGTLSAGIVLLLWLNWSSLIVLLGAQMNVTIGKAMSNRSRKSSRQVG